VRVSKEHRTVRRVTTILETVATRAGGVRLATLAEVLDAPKSSVHGLVQGLIAAGYLTDDDGEYHMGPAARVLLSGPDRPSLAERAHPAMVRLRDRFDETVTLGEPVGDSVVYIHTVESAQPVRYSPPLRERRPLYPTAMGKLVLAHMSARRSAAHLDPADRERVLDELARVRADGVAYDRAESVPGLSAVGAPITADGAVVACLTIAGPADRVTDRLTDYAPVLGAAARDLSTGPR
jgi:DNA-binding IclR family transcriptional regulator